ncbi:MAG: methyltransferase domain-containing protein [Candidatus Helarchaeota archaeon]
MIEENFVEDSKALHDEQTMEFIDIGWLVDHHMTKLEERTAMIESLNFKPGDTVLDLGCGPGLWTPLLAEQIKPDGHVTGMDISKDLIEYATKNLEEDLEDNIEYQTGDFHNIPFKDNTFDVTFFGNCFAYVTDHKTVLDELKRVTKKGGRVIAKDFDGAIIIFHPIDPHLQLKVLAANAKGLQENPPDPPFDNYTGRKMNGLFREAGFKNISTKTYAIQKVAPLTPEAKRYITGNAEWYAKLAAPYMTKEEVQKWHSYFDTTSKSYILDLEEFYFCMLEIITIGTC